VRFQAFPIYSFSTGLVQILVVLCRQL